MSEINLPFTCKQGWIGFAVVTFLLCSVPIVVNYDSDLLTTSSFPMFFWGIAFFTILLCIISEKKGWSFPTFSCRCDKK